MWAQNLLRKARKEGLILNDWFCHVLIKEVNPAITLVFCGNCKKAQTLHTKSYLSYRAKSLEVFLYFYTGGQHGQLERNADLLRVDQHPPGLHAGDTRGTQERNYSGNCSTFQVVTLAVYAYFVACLFGRQVCCHLSPVTCHLSPVTCHLL